MARSGGGCADTSVQVGRILEYRDVRCAAPYRVSTNIFRGSPTGAYPWRTDSDGRAGDHAHELVLLSLVHQEPVNLSADPLLEGKASPDKDPYSANQAIPTLLVTRYSQRLALIFPDLRVRHVRWLSLFAYPLSGGFKPWSLIPSSLIGPVLRFEDVVSGIIGRLLGFKILIAIEKRPLSNVPSPGGL